VINNSDVSTLDEMFRERVRRSADKLAYSQYDDEDEEWIAVTWAEVALQVERWQVAFREQGLVKGDRVAICYKNSLEWVIFDQAALRLGLVVVPLYIADRAESIAFMLADSGASLALFHDQGFWNDVANCTHDLSHLTTVLVFNSDPSNGTKNKTSAQIFSVKPIAVDKWLPKEGRHFERGVTEPNDLASIVYTSGATGRPKGVMLSHRNMLSNAFNGMRSIPLRTDDCLLSFLPLSHILERTVGYYSPMMCSASVYFNQSIDKLHRDLLEVQPSVMVSVPRVFERIHNQISAEVEGLSAINKMLFRRALKTGWHRFQHHQGVFGWHPRLLLSSLLDKFVAEPIRKRLGGRLEFVVVGGAALSADVAKTFIALGVPLLQGYGLTEASPIVSVNTKSRNRLGSIGLPLRGVEVRLAEDDEIWVRGDNIMMGYWARPDATASTLVNEGEQVWLKTGDCGSIDAEGFIRITGRIKDVLVLATGEKVAPTDIEASIQNDPLFEQVMVLGESKSFLSALVVLNKSKWEEIAAARNFSLSNINTAQVQAFVLKRIRKRMGGFPEYARIRKVHISWHEWTIESDLVTHTFKLKRARIMQKFAAEIEKIYAERRVHKL
jgi:long-chain acyl-CoA synthetase